MVLTQNLTTSKSAGHISLCIQPPSPCTNKLYIICLYHQGMREVVVDVDPPVAMYNALCPEFAFWTFLGMCWWSILEEYTMFVKYKGQLVCHWGGKSILQQLPYKHGHGAGGV
jgi:hypothetical protein